MPLGLGNLVCKMLDYNRKLACFYPHSPSDTPANIPGQLIYSRIKTITQN